MNNNNNNKRPAPPSSSSVTQNSKRQKPILNENARAGWNEPVSPGGGDNKTKQKVVIVSQFTRSITAPSRSVSASASSIATSSPASASSSSSSSKLPSIHEKDGLVTKALARHYLEDQFRIADSKGKVKVLIMDFSDLLIFTQSQQHECLIVPELLIGLGSKRSTFTTTTQNNQQQQQPSHYLVAVWLKKENAVYVWGFVSRSTLLYNDAVPLLSETELAQGFTKSQTITKLSRHCWSNADVEPLVHDSLVFIHQQKQRHQSNKQPLWGKRLFPSQCLRDIPQFFVNDDINTENENTDDDAVNES